MRRFFAVRRPSWAGLVSAYAVAIGLLMLYGGVGHTVAVTAIHIRSGLPYSYRFASLLTTGGVLVFGALTNLVLARWIALGRSWAFAWSLAATAAVTTHTALLLPVDAARDAAGPAFVLSASYVIFAAVAWTAIARRRTAA